MKREEAKKMISKGINIESACSWLDLGSGSGTFTYAMADLLPSGSEILATDLNHQYFDRTDKQVLINFQKGNFETDHFRITQLNGILMANSLHFVKDKARLINKYEMLFTSSYKWIIVEYDHNNSSQWVPFPVDFNQLKELYYEQGYTNIQKIGERESIYGGKMYAALITKNNHDNKNT